jgi:hypothetical protein
MMVSQSKKYYRKLNIAEVVMLNKLEWWFYNWISGWMDMICGLISVCTLTLYRPWWDFKFRTWSSTVVLKRKIKERKNNERS